MFDDWSVVIFWLVFALMSVFASVKSLVVARRRGDVTCLPSSKSESARRSVSTSR